MRINRLGALVWALLAFSTAAPAYADEPISYTGPITLPNGATSNGKVLVSPTNPLPITTAGGGTTVKATAVAPTFVEGSTTNQLSSDLSGGLRVSGSISATSATKSTAADPSYTEGVTTNPVSVDLSGYARTFAKQAGTWTVQIGNTPNTTAIKVDGSAVTQPVSGTVTANIGTVGTLATAANQSTEITSLGTIATNSGTQATAANQTSVIGSKAAGTAAASSVLQGVVFNTTLPTLTNGQQAAMQSDSSGRLIIADGLAQGSATSGQTGNLNLGAVTTAAPTYTTGQSSPLSLDTAGNLRVNIVTGASSGAVAQGSTTSGQTGLLVQGAVTTAAPSYTTAQTSPLSLTTAGEVRANVTTSALPSGASTSANQSTEITALGTVNTNLTNVTGTKAAGTAAANSLLTGGVYNSGGVTLTTGQQAALQVTSAGALIVSGAGGGTQYAEDAAHVSGDLGTVALVVRKDTATQIAGTDGDYSALVNDASGRLWVNVGADAVQGTTSDTSASNTMFGALLAIKTAAQDTTTVLPYKIDQTTPGTTNGVVVNSSALPTGASTEATLAETHGTKAAGTAVTKSELAGGVYNTSLPTLTNGQQAANQMDASGRLLMSDTQAQTKLDTLNTSINSSVPAGSAIIGKVGIDQTTPGTTNGVTPVAVTSGGLSTCRVVTGTTGFCKASAGTAFHVIYQNTNAAVRYLHIYNKASAPTLSTDTPIATVQMALTSRGEADFSVYGISGSSGIAWAVTTDDIAIPATAGTSGDLHMTLAYK